MSGSSRGSAAEGGGVQTDHTNARTRGVGHHGHGGRPALKLRQAHRLGLACMLMRRAAVCEGWRVCVQGQRQGAPDLTDLP
jgi:hypothetical protein